MALRGRGLVSVGAVVACCALAAACTQEPAQTGSPSLTPVATTPSESQIERQMRLDYEAAEEAYRATSSRNKSGCIRRVAATEATSALKRPRPASYLRITLMRLRDAS